MDKITRVPSTQYTSKIQLGIHVELISLFKLPGKLIEGIESSNQMLKTYVLPFRHSQRMRSPRCVLDLSPIDTSLCQLRDLLLGDSTSSWAHLVDERGPDLLFGFLGELAEMQSDVNAGEECLIKCFHAIGGEEQNAAVVLNMSKAERREYN